MPTTKEEIVILYAEDDEEDRLLTEEALDEAKLANARRYVKDGEELLDYLRRRGRFADPEAAPRPGLILLDLNMPRKDGWEALQEIKADEDLRRIPVVVLTTSKAEEDVVKSYDLGVAGFITKPVTFDGLLQVVQALSQYWLQVVELPTADL